MKKTGAILVLALLAVPTVSEARDRGRYSSGSIRHRPGPPPRPHPRPPYRPPRPGVTDAYIRHEIRKEIRREIRDARRDRFLFLGGLAVLGAITRSLPPRHTTIVVQGSSYYYAEGTWYVAAGGQYRCVPPPIGAVVTVVPPNAYVVVWGGVRYHYFNGAFYAPRGAGYAIVAPPRGVIVPALPQGYVQQGDTYEYGGVAYNEVLGPDGEPGYQVVGAP
ncbi:MAG: hypothetical protein KJ062_01010 [Thermoanaerobaculia bacterium]|nr:hypothetical protein [Thermoanaerobaculia bacterium]